MYVCRLLTRIKRTCYTIENKIMRMQMSKKRRKTQYYAQLEKARATRR